MNKILKLISTAQQQIIKIITLEVLLTDIFWFSNYYFWFKNAKKQITYVLITFISFNDSFVFLLINTKFVNIWNK